MKITELRNTQSKGWVADGYVCSGAVLKISVPVAELDANDLIAFALTDPDHILNAETFPFDAPTTTELTNAAYMEPMQDPRTPDRIAMDEWQAEYNDDPAGWWKGIQPIRF